MKENEEDKNIIIYEDNDKNKILKIYGIDNQF